MISKRSKEVDRVASAATSELAAPCDSLEVTAPALGSIVENASDAQGLPARQPSHGGEWETVGPNGKKDKKKKKKKKGRKN
jgi:hypothetical protein